VQIGRCKRVLRKPNGLFGRFAANLDRFLPEKQIGLPAQSGFEEIEPD